MYPPDKPNNFTIFVYVGEDVVFRTEVRAQTLSEALAVALARREDEIRHPD